MYRIPIPIGAGKQQKIPDSAENGDLFTLTAEPDSGFLFELTSITISIPPGTEANVTITTDLGEFPLIKKPQESPESNNLPVKGPASITLTTNPLYVPMMDTEVHIIPPLRKVRKLNLYVRVTDATSARGQTVALEYGGEMVIYPIPEPPIRSKPL